MGDIDGNREMAQDGKDITAATMPAGGWGIRGWLSAILKQLITYVVTISFPHDELHEGSAYSTYFFNTTANADDARTVIAFETPDVTKWGHIVTTISASSPAELIVLEGPTLDLDEGNEEPIYNRNRNSGNVSIMKPITTAGTPGEISTFIEAEIAGATLVGGTEIDYFQLAGGEGPQSVGGADRSTQEWILKQDTIYLFILQNIGAPGAGGNLHTIKLGWYEHTL